MLNISAVNSISNQKKIKAMINRFSMGKKKILINQPYANKVIIVDFYNLYCSITRFNKYKTFSRESYIHCLDLITKKFQDNDLIIVSKDVFEIEQEYIKTHTARYPNMTYIISNDTHHEKSVNRERDDYTCLLMNNSYSGHDVLLVSNDKLRNIEKIIKYVKPMKLQIFKSGLERTLDITLEQIQNNRDVLIEKSRPVTAEFKFE